MLSPALQNLLPHTHGDDRQREAASIRPQSAAHRHPRSDQNDATSITSAARHDRRSTRRFLRHYAEMVAAMFIGMFALAKPADWLFSALGTSTSSQHPVMMVLSMGITMTVPMVAWMRFRGHGWRPINEMAASMLVPTFAAMALVGTGLVSGSAVMIPEHVAMLAGMLFAMLLRRDEYSVAHHNHARPAIAA